MTDLAPSTALVRIERRTAAEVLEDVYGSLTPKTLDAYKRDLRAFARFLGGIPVPDAVGSLFQCDRGEANSVVRRWDNAMIEADLATATRARRISTINTLVRAAREAGLVEWALDVKRPRVQAYRDTRGPGEDAVHRLFAACGDDLVGRRDRFLLVLLYLLALRRFEAAKARLGDYDRPGRRFRVIGKRGQEKWIDLRPALVAEFDSWIELIGIALPSERLLCSLKRGGRRPLSLSGVNHVLDLIGARAGVEVWPHGLRHTAITTVLNGKHGVREAKGFSRHADVRTLFVYDDQREQLGSDAQEYLAERMLGRKP